MSVSYSFHELKNISHTTYIYIVKRVPPPHFTIRWHRGYILIQIQPGLCFQFATFDPYFQPGLSGTRSECPICGLAQVSHPPPLPPLPPRACAQTKKRCTRWGFLNLGRNCAILFLRWERRTERRRESVFRPWKKKVDSKQNKTKTRRQGFLCVVRERTRDLLNGGTHTLPRI